MADDDKDQKYDPSGRIVIPPENLRAFQDLSQPATAGEESVDERAKAAIRAQLSASDFGQLRAEDFGGGRGYFHHSAGFGEAEGEFPFLVNQGEFKETLATVGHTVGRNPHFANVRINLFRERLKLQTFCQAAFCEYLLPLLAPCPAIPADRAEELAIAFNFHFATLWGLVRAFPDSTIEFVYIPLRQRLLMQTRDTNDVIQKDFQLACRDRLDFPDYHSRGRLASPVLIGQVNPTVLLHAINYTSLFAQQDQTRQTLNLIELRDGTLYGGTQMRMGQIAAPALQQVQLKIKFESIATVAKMLARFNPEEITLWKTPTFYILTDQSLFFGFERYAFDFPDVSFMYEHRAGLTNLDSWISGVSA